MKSRITKSEKEKILAETIKQQLSNARTTGMGIGAKSIAMVILEKANAKDKTDSEKLSDIVNFCKIGLNVKEEI